MATGLYIHLRLQLYIEKVMTSSMILQYNRKTDQLSLWEW
jgi:hypothetical protein